MIITSHHRASSLYNGTEPGLGVGQAFPDALTGADWVSYLGTHPHVIMHLAAHTHVMSVVAQQPLGGHAFWDVTSPSLADFPHQLRMLEVWDQDENGFLTRSAPSPSTPSPRATQSPRPAAPSATSTTPPAGPATAAARPPTTATSSCR